VVADAALRDGRLLSWMATYELAVSKHVMFGTVEIAFCKLLAWALEVDTEAGGGGSGVAHRWHKQRAKDLAKEVRPVSCSDTACVLVRCCGNLVPWPSTQIQPELGSEACLSIV
jgi:hypothetical protein